MSIRHNSDTIKWPVFPNYADDDVHDSVPVLEIFCTIAKLNHQQGKEGLFSFIYKTERIHNKTHLMTHLEQVQAKLFMINRSCYCRQDPSHLQRQAAEKLDPVFFSNIKLCLHVLQLICAPPSAWTGSSSVNMDATSSSFVTHVARAMLLSTGTERTLCDKTSLQE